jgi:hypothetical protein
VSVLEGGEERGDGVHHHLNIKNWVENNLPGELRTSLQERGSPHVKGTILVIQFKELRIVGNK